MEKQKKEKSNGISDNQLILFIKEARNKGYGDFEIKQILLKHNWPKKRIERGFYLLDKSHNIKNQICIFLDKDIIKILEKRAKKNLFNLNEQVEDIIRRSCASYRRKKVNTDPIDDLLIKVFSRKKTSKPKKTKMKK